MRTLTFLTFIQLIISGLSAYLLSQMSWIGRMGINLFYQEYKILKNPIESGIIIFILQMLVVFILFMLYRFASKRMTDVFAILVLLFALVGLGYSIYDFTQEFSHRILKTYFHVGGYLFWIGFIISCLIYLFKSKRVDEIIEDEAESV